MTGGCGGEGGTEGGERERETDRQTETERYREGERETHTETKTRALFSTSRVWCLLRATLAQALPLRCAGFSNRDTGFQNCKVSSRITSNQPQRDAILQRNDDCDLLSL